MPQATIGQRIAAYRRRRGISQATLAALVGRSESWLSQVERGVRSVDRLSVLLEMATALRVDVESLTGRPWQYAPNGGSIVGGLENVRKVLSRYSHLVDDVEPGSTSADDLRRRVALVHTDYQAARYGHVVRALPDLLTSADQLRTEDGGVNDPETLLVYVGAYVAGAKLLTKLGSADLAAVAADRAAMSAGEIDSFSAQGMAIYQVVCALLRADRTDEAENLAIRMAERLIPNVRSDAPDLLSVTGALWLISAVIAARRNDRAQVWERLNQAEQLAGLLGHDGNHAWTAFGPTNVAIHRVSVAADLGDPAEALEAASRVNVDLLPEGLSSRRAQVHLDLAWAQSQRRRDAEAVLHLLEAERVAPEVIRFNVLVREILREILTRQRRRPSTTLTELAARAGALE